MRFSACRLRAACPPLGNIRPGVGGMRRKRCPSNQPGTGRHPPLANGSTGSQTVCFRVRCSTFVFRPPEADIWTIRESLRPDDHPPFQSAPPGSVHGACKALSRLLHGAYTAIAQLLHGSSPALVRLLYGSTTALQPPFWSLKATARISQAARQGPGPWAASRQRLPSPCLPRHCCLGDAAALAMHCL